MLLLKEKMFFGVSSVVRIIIIPDEEKKNSDGVKNKQVQTFNF